MRRNRVLVVLVTTLLTMMVFIQSYQAPGIINTPDEENRLNYDSISITSVDSILVSQHEPDWNNYGGNTMDVDWHWQNNVRYRSLVRFDLSVLPEPIQIVNAVIRLYCNVINPVGGEIYAHRILDDWNENSVTWNNQPNHYSTYTDVALVEQSNNNYFWNVTNDVISFIDGIENNYGWKFKFLENFEGPTQRSAAFTTQYWFNKPIILISYYSLLPTANFSYSPENPIESEEIIFQDLSTDVDGLITNWLWDFDDGNTSIIQNPKHTYSNPGNYTVILNVTDDNGFTDEIQKTVFCLQTPNIVYISKEYSNSTPGWQYTHFDVIQDGIDAVAEDGTVYVYNGTYYENVIIDKNVDIIGENENTTIIDGIENGDGITIEEKNVNISDFTIKNCTQDNAAGIKILNSICTLKNINIYDGIYGIYIKPVTHDYSYSITSQVTIDTCNVYDNINDGIFADISLSYSGGFNQGWTADYTVDIIDSMIADNGGSGVYYNVYGKTTQWYHYIDIDLDAYIRNSTISGNTNGVNTSYYKSGPDCYVDYSLNLTATDIKNNTIYGFHMDNIAISENEVNNSENGLFDYHGYCHTQGDWEWKEKSSYNFTNSIVINPGHCLLIQPGTNIEFYGSQSQLVIYGKITSEGTVEKPIILTHCTQLNTSSWGGIVLDEINIDSSFSHLNITDADVGLFIKSSSLTVSHIQIYNCANEGIIIKNSHVTFQYLTVYNASYGVHITPSPNGYYDDIVSTIVLDNCYIHDNEHDGIFADISLSYSGGFNQGWTADYTVDIIDSMIADNGGSGVYYNVYGKTTQWYHYIDIDLDAYIRNSTISGNTNGVNTSYYKSGPDCYVDYNLFVDKTSIRDNTYGIRLIHSLGNTITNNTIKNNMVGLKLDASSIDNKIHTNQFINNINQSHDEGNNYWNTYYPIGGNYWSDFDEESEGAYDLFSGPDQNISGSDDIIDTPYNISGGMNIDYYPLTKSNGWINNPPHANFTYSPIYPYTNQLIYFNGSLSYDSDGFIANYTWDFNDGNISYQTQPVHQFSTAGIFTISLTVTDDDGAVNTTYESLSVSGVDINQSIFDRGFPIRHALDGDWAAAQSFIPTLDIISSAEIQLRKFGTPEFNLTVELRENHPQGILIDTLTFTPTEVPSSWEWFPLNFVDTPITPGTDYFIVCPPAPSGVTTSFGYEWGYAFGNQYDDGAFWFTRDGGGLWRDLPTMYEFVFRTYGYC